MHLSNEIKNLSGFFFHVKKFCAYLFPLVYFIFFSLFRKMYDNLNLSLRKRMWAGVVMNGEGEGLEAMRAELGSQATNTWILIKEKLEGLHPGIFPPSCCLFSLNRTTQCKNIPNRSVWGFFFKWEKDPNLFADTQQVWRGCKEIISHFLN